MPGKRATGKVDPKLEDAINKMIKEVTLDKTMPSGNVDGDGKAIMVQKYTFKDVTAAIGLKLKLEAIKLKADDSGYGSGFKDEPEDDQ